jgi:hypothetical protein
MADNTVLNAGSGGDTIATDDVAGVKYQVVKLAVGADGAASLVANANPIPVSDAGGSLTVDGTVAVTGVATAAKQDTQQTSLDAIAASVAGTLTVGSHAVTNAGTFAVQATVAAGATTIGKAEDAAHSSGDVGVMALSVRQDAAAALAGTDADYQPLITDASGRLHVNVGNTVTVGSHAVTNAGTFVTQENGAALTSLQLIDDAIYAEDVASQAADKGVAVLAVRRDADTSMVGTDGDYANLQVNAAGSLKVAITAGAGSGGTSIADGASFTRDTTSITPAGAAVESSAPTLTNGDVAALSMTTGGALRVAVAAGGVAAAVEDVASAGGEEGVMVLAVRRDSASSGVSTDGDFAALSVTSDGSLRAAVSNTVTVASHAVTNAGTFAVQESGSALTALQLIDDPVFADDAAYTLSTSKANVIAGIAVETDGTDPTTVSAEGDAAAVRTDRARRLLVGIGHPRFFNATADYGSAQTNASLQGAPGASLSLYITDIIISNGATAGKITLLDGSGGTVKFTLYPAINGGCAISLANPIRLTANTALCVTSTTVTTHAVNVCGYIAP